MIAMYYSDVFRLNRDAKARRAAEHHEQMLRYNSADIDASVAGAVIVNPRDPLPPQEPPKTHKVNITITPTDTVQALCSLSRMDVCVHNFASYKRPGGGFLTGAMAQEEALCHASTLYEVLSRFEDYYEWNMRHPNGNMYTDRMLWTPFIRFDTGANVVREASVITCAAPNFGASKASRDENTECLRHRIDRLFLLAEHMGVRALITGAWGCGVFKQDPYEVAQLMFERAMKFTGSTVVFAIPSGRDNSYQAFRETWRNMC